MHLCSQSLPLVSRRLQLLLLPTRNLRLQHPAIVLLLLLGSQWPLRVAGHLRERGVDRRVSVSAVERTTVIIIVTVTTYIDLHPGVGDGRQQLVLVLITISHDASHVQMVSLRVRGSRVKHQATLAAVVRAQTVKLVDVGQHRGLAEGVGLTLKSETPVAYTSLRGSAVLGLLCLHDGVHVFVIDRHSVSRCPLPIAGVSRNGIAPIAGLPHCKLLRALGVLRPLV